MKAFSAQSQSPYRAFGRTGISANMLLNMPSGITRPQRLPRLLQPNLRVRKYCLSQASQVSRLWYSSSRNVWAFSRYAFHCNNVLWFGVCHQLRHALRMNAVDVAVGVENQFAPVFVPLPFCDHF